MLDELLGRAKLQDRIDELEDERRHLQRQLDAEAERRADAVRDKQTAEERVNRLQDRIAEQEDRIERAGTEERARSLRGTETLRGDRLRTVLNRLESLEAGPEGAFTAMIVDDVPPEATEAFGEQTALLARTTPCLAVTDDAGLISATLEPPVRPDAFARWSDGFEFDREWFLPTGTFGFALVRSDVFAYGEYEGDRRQSFTGFTSDVKSQHGKGGFSQSRFERRRDAQIDEHLERCQEELAERNVEQLFVVGQRTVLGEFEDVAAHTATVDATGDPEAALADAFQQFWTTKLSLI